MHNPGVQKEPQEITELHILAYCLVLASTPDQKNEYRRVDITEILILDRRGLARDFNKTRKLIGSVKIFVARY